MKTNQREQRKPLTYGRVVSCGFSGARPESDEEAYQRALAEKIKEDRIDDFKDAAQKERNNRDLYGIIAGALPVAETIFANSRGPEGLRFVEQFKSLIHQGYFNDTPYELMSLPIIAGLTAYALYGAIASHFMAKSLDAEINKVVREDKIN